MDKIGAYRILETLRGGPQRLYKVTSPDGRVLALKAAPMAELTAEARERFAREGETCRTIDHPNLVRVVETGEADGLLYQAMDLLEGGDLDKVMAEGRSFTWDEKLSIMEQICEGLAYAHERRLVHRDIKPANLFLENTGRAVVLDFGMVRVAESELTKVGAAVGTLNYMAPEQIRGERCTPASDVFSAGIVFYQLAAGRHPFSSKDRSLGQVVSAIVFEAPPRLSSLCPDAPGGLEYLLNRALEKDQAKRFQNAGELRQAITVCRLALAQGINPEALAVSSTPAASRPAPIVDGEKTRILERPQPSPAPTPKLPTPPPAQPAGPVKPQPALRFRYCPSCTTANPPEAMVCGKCGVPLASRTERGGNSKNKAVLVAIAVLGLLVIVLAAVLAAKR